jgi:hypothetical protein
MGAYLRYAQLAMENDLTSTPALLAAVVPAAALEAVVVLVGPGDPLVLPLPRARARAAGAEENLADRVALAFRLATLGHILTFSEARVTVELPQTSSGDYPIHF